jgi:hypothetical protein
MLTRSGIERPATEENLWPKDAIATGPDAAATIELANGEEVELGPDGLFTIDLEGGIPVLDVKQGLVLTRKRDRAATPGEATSGESGDSILLTISTPFGITRIGATDVVDLVVDGSSVRLDVLVGEIEIVGANGERTVLSQGRRQRLGEVNALPVAPLMLDLRHGSAEVLPNGTRKFVRLRAADADRVAAGDTLRVNSGYLTAASGGNGRVTLTKGAEILVGSSGRSAAAAQVGLGLKKGAIEVLAPAKEELIVPVAGDLSIVTKGQARYTVTKTADGYVVTSLVGDVSVEREGFIPLRISGGGTAKVSAKGADVAAPSREAVVLPSRNGLKLYQSSVRRVSLEWPADEAVKRWHVIASTDSSLESPILEGDVQVPFVSVPVPPKGPIHWRVSANGSEVARGNVAIAPEPSDEALSRFRNVVPDGPDTTTIFYPDNPPVVTLTWEKDSEAAKYRVLVYRKGNLTKPFLERVVVDEKVALPESTMAEGQYLWSLTPLDGRGREIRGGRMNKLHMVYDNAVPRLVVLTPHNGASVGGKLRTTGIAPLGGRLFINGKSVRLDEKSRFDTTTTTLAGGRIVYRVVHGASEYFVVRTVRGR